MKTICSLQGLSIRALLLGIFMIAIIWQSMAQVDVLILQSGKEIKGKIVEETLGGVVKIQDISYQLFTVSEQDIQQIQRPLAIKGYWEVIHLQKGGMIRGFLLEYDWLRSVKLEDARRNVFEFRWDEILKISKEPIPDEKRLLDRSAYLMKKTRQKGKQSERTAYPGYGLFFAEGGGLFANENGNRSRIFPGVFGQAILSMYVTESFTIGLGFGMDWIQREQGIGDIGQYGFVDGRYYLPQEGWTPYVAMAGGYDWYRRGVYANPGLGVRKKLFNKFWLNANLSVKLQQIGEQTFSEVFEPGTLEMIQLKLVID